MNKYNLFNIFLICVLLNACQRSAGYQGDALYAAKEPVSDGGRPRKTSTQRLESMGQPKKKMFVLDFVNQTPVTQGNLGVFAADELKRGVLASQRVTVPEDIRSELSTGDFLQGDQIRVAQLMREGRRLGVAVLIVGRVTKAVFRQKGEDVGLLRQKQSIAAIDVEMKVFDVAAGREVLAIGRAGEASSNNMVALGGGGVDKPEFRAELLQLAARRAVEYLVPDVMRAIEKMAWQGRVVKVSGSKVFINAGRGSGLVMGDILRVLTPGDEVYDPVTSAYLGRTQGQVKGTLEVIDFIGQDAAQAELHTGGQFQEGDTVQLY